MTVLVAGIGNLFSSDDGFGPEVVRRLAEHAPGPDGHVRVVDYGIRGMHLAYDLLDGYDALVIVDAVPQRRRPRRGHRPRGRPRRPAGAATSTRTAWTRWRCSPRSGSSAAPSRRRTSWAAGRPTTEDGIGLSEPVAAAVPVAVGVVGAPASTTCSCAREA